MATFTFPGEPIPKARPRFSGSGHAYTPARVKEAENAIRWQLKSQGTKPTSEPVQVELYFRCKSQTADLDNLVKLVLDACQRDPKDPGATQGFLWENDQQVRRFVNVEIEHVSSEPRTEITVSAFVPREKRAA